jgi:predicted acetylornithine/succinylornithine family transaminase
VTAAPTVGSPLLGAYARSDVTFVDGRGAWLEDAEGRRYLDFLGGIAVVGLGHCHPAPLAAARMQLDRLWHTSNLFWTEPMAALAERLSDRLGGGEAFFCNSGAEAVEAAIKYARKATGRPGIVALEGSFHGRTMGALSVTGQTAKSKPFEPLLPGVRFARLNDTESLAAAVDVETACILIEPVQGEGGIRPATSEFLAAARELADASGALLILDEIQCGIGRTGTFFAHEGAGVRPDAVVLAKALANGLPIGCLLVADSTAGAFEPGDHGSTFGGNPVACAAACAVLDTLTDELLAAVRAKGERLRGGLAGLSAVGEVRGHGLLVGADVDRPAREVVAACLERRLVVGSAGERTIRFAPPLTITEYELAVGLERFAEVMA